MEATMYIYVKSLTYCICLLLCFSACTEKVNVNIEIKAIQEADSTWLLAVTNKDIDLIMSLYDDHATWRHTDGPALQGKDIIRNRWLNFFDDQEGTLFWEPQKIEISEFENLACSIGTGDVSYRNHNNELKEARFDYVAIWKMNDSGEWKLAVDISSFVN